MKFYDCIEKNKDKNISIYCDMDGVKVDWLWKNIHWLAN